MERRKEMMIAALWANSGFEGEEGTTARRDAIEDLEANYLAVTEKIMAGTSVTDEEEEIADPYGFFKAGKRGVEKLGEPRDDEGTVREVIDYSEIDQHG